MTEKPVKDNGTAIGFGMVQFAMFDLILVLIAGCVGRREVSESVIFWLYQIFCISLPGIVICRRIKIGIRTDFELLVLGYFAGYIMNLALYYVLAPFMGDISPIGFRIGMGIIAVTSLICICKERDFRIRSDKGGKCLGLAFILVYFALLTVLYNGRNILPPAADADLPNDVCIWLGNTISLMKKFPPVNFIWYVHPLAYHYFSSMQLAVLSLVSGLEASGVAFSFSYVQSTFLLMGGSYLALREFANKKYIIAGAMTVLFFTTGVEAQSTVTYATHLFLEPFGLEYGLAFSFLLIYLIRRFFRIDIRPGQTAVILICLAALLGIKLPLGCILLVYLGIICISWLFSGRIKKAFGTGISLIAVFLLIFFGVCNSHNTYPMSLNWYESAQEQAEEPAEGVPEEETEREPVPEEVSGQEDSPGLWLRFKIFVYDCLEYVYQANPVIMILGVVFFLLKLLVCRRISVEDIATISAWGTGVFIGSQGHMIGMSEMYFIMGTFPIVVCWTAYNLDMVLQAAKVRVFRAAICVPVMIVIAFGIRNTRENTYFCLKDIWPVAIERVRHPREEGKNIYGASITRAEYAACQYVKSETETQDIIYEINAVGLSHLYGLFTERYSIVYNEMISREYLLRKIEDELPLARGQKEVFVIVAEEIEKTEQQLDELGECVFEQEGVKVLKVTV